jgi:hypothetical protein
MGWGFRGGHPATVEKRIVATKIRRWNLIIWFIPSSPSTSNSHLQHGAMPGFSISATASLFTNRNYRIHGHPAYRLTPKQPVVIGGTPRPLEAYNLMRMTVYAGLMCLPTREIWPSLPMIRMRRAARGFIGLRGISRRICKPLARACRRTTRPPIRLNKA